MKKMEADIIVVAAGLSGLAASIAAAEEGKRVITFEKSNSTGGAASMGMGVFGLNSRIQRMSGQSLDPDEAFLKHMNFTHMLVDDARLVYDFYRKSGETIDWLEDMGVQFEFNTTTQYVPPRARSIIVPELTIHHVIPDGGGHPRPRAASSMTRIMTERAKELGVDFHMQTPVTDLILENGIIKGVKAKTADGEEIEAAAKAVILATGGFGDNPEMIREYTGYEWGKDLFSFRIPGNVGDGMRMAWKAGAARTRTMMELMYQIPDNLNHFDLEGAFRQPVLWVNKMGKRFFPEDCLGITSYTGNAIAMQPGHTCFTIMDAATLKYYKKHGVSNPGVHGTDVFDRFDEAAEEAKKENYSAYFEAESIEELCEKTGIDLEGLQETLEEYNDDCELKYDSVFNKGREFMLPVKKAPFYAIQSFLGAYGTLGGIKINHKTEVLTEAYKPIPGLYAVGTDAANIYGDTYIFTMPANTMGFCINTGRIAAENASDYIDRL